MKMYLFVAAAAAVAAFIIGCAGPKNVSLGEKFVSVSAADFKNEIDKNSADNVILDIRTPEEFASGHIKGAVNLDFYLESFQTELNALDKTKTYLIYCRSGNRTSQTLSIMKDLGFTNVINMENGIIDWSNNNFALEN